MKTDILETGGLPLETVVELIKQLQERATRDDNLRVFGLQSIADRLDCSVDFVEDEIRRGEMKSIKVGRCRKVTAEEFRAYLDRKLKEAKERRKH